MERPSLRWIALFVALGSLALAGCGGKADLKFVGAPDTSSCGDETVDADEKCDDGNTEDGDGCSKECQPEEGYVCVGKKNSSCAKTCGNDKLDAGETCEDGNTTKGDGCDASCQIEGSCSEPVVLDVSSGKATIDSSINGGGGGSDKVACGDGDAGDGPDRVFQFELTDAADVTLKLSSSFNGLVRFASAACDSDSELACANSEGAGSDESIVYRDVSPGTYYVIVDSVGSTTKGDFTLDVVLGCPLSNLKLSRVTPYWGGDGFSVVEVVNRSSSCSIDLKQFHLGVSDGTLRDVPFKSGSLGAGKRFSIAGSSAYSFTGDQTSSNVSLSATYFLVSLCVGICTQNDSGNVLDLIQSGYVSGETVVAPELPSDATFTPAALTRNVSYFTSYVRKSFTGKSGKFKASDWVTSFDLVPEETMNTYGLYALTATSISPQSKTIIDDPAGIEGKILRVLGDADTSGYTGYYMALPTNFKPVNVTVKMARPATDTAAPGFALGAGPSTSVHSDSPLIVLDQAATLYLDSHGLTTSVTASDWHTVTFDNFDWSVAPTTVDLLLNGSETFAGVSFSNPIDQLQLLTYGANDVVDFAEIHLTE